MYLWCAFRIPSQSQLNKQPRILPNATQFGLLSVRLVLEVLLVLTVSRSPSLILVIDYMNMITHRSGAVSIDLRTNPAVDKPATCIEAMTEKWNIVIGCTPFDVRVREVLSATVLFRVDILPRCY